MKRLALLAGGALLALSSALVIAQDAPESLLPPGFDRPRPSRAAPAAPPSAPAAQAGGAVSVPVVQAIPGAPAGAALPAGTKVPSLKELEAMSPDELDELLGLKPKSDMPPAARRSMRQVGVIASYEGGLPSAALARQSPDLVRAALDRNKGQLVSR